MAYTPRFNTNDDGGWWAGDYGERICEWTYDTPSGELRVTIPGKSVGKMRVIKRGEPIDKNLLARVALDLARQITGKAFDV
jgi:hypothetical protein